MALRLLGDVFKKKDSSLRLLGSEPDQQNTDDPSWKRSDGSQKGLGYFGELNRPDGKTSTELSIGVNFDGQEIEIPSLVPTLTQQEVEYMMQGNPATESIVNKAVAHYRDRQRQQKSPFAQYGEQNPIMQVGQDSKALEEQYLGQPKETQQMNDLQNVVNIQKREGAAEKLRLLSDKAFDAGNIESLSDPKKMAADAARTTARGVFPNISPFIKQSDREKAGLESLIRATAAPQQTLFEFSEAPEKGIKSAITEAGKSFRKEKEPLTASYLMRNSKVKPLNIGINLPTPAGIYRKDVTLNSEQAGNLEAAFMDIFADPLWLAPLAIKTIKKISNIKWADIAIKYKHGGKIPKIPAMDKIFTPEELSLFDLAGKKAYMSKYGVKQYKNMMGFMGQYNALLRGEVVEGTKFFSGIPLTGESLKRIATTFKVSIPTIEKIAAGSQVAGIAAETVDQIKNAIKITSKNMQQAPRPDPKDLKASPPFPEKRMPEESADNLIEGGLSQELPEEAFPYLPPEKHEYVRELFRISDKDQIKNLIKADPDYLAAEQRLAAMPDQKDFKELDYTSELPDNYQQYVDKFINVPAPSGQKEALIMIGVPASQKSMLLKQWGKKETHVLIDNDEAKNFIPEFQNDKALAQYVHSESDHMAGHLLKIAAKRDLNVVIPKIGKGEESMRTLINSLKDSEYKINLVYNELSSEESMKRAFKRFLEEGRLVNIDYIDDSSLKIKPVYDKIKKDVDEFSYYNVNVPWGKNLIEIEKGGKNVSARKEVSGEGGSGQQLSTGKSVEGRPEGTKGQPEFPEITPKKIPIKEQPAPEVSTKKVSTKKVSTKKVSTKKVYARQADEGIKNALAFMDAELAASQLGNKNVGIDAATGDHFSTGGKQIFPNFWKAGWDRKRIRKIITKMIEDKPLTKSEQLIAEKLSQEAIKRYQKDPKKYLETYDYDDLDARLGLPEETEADVSQEVYNEFDKLLEDEKFAEAEAKVRELKIKRDARKANKKAQITFDLADKDSARALVAAYEVQKDLWIGNKDVRLLQNKIERARTQTEIKELGLDKDNKGRLKFGKNSKDIDEAIKVYIDLKRNPEDLAKYYKKLTPEQQRITDLSQNLPPEAKKIADKIAASDKAIGLESKDQGIIRNTLENHMARIWDIPKEKVGLHIFKKFGTTTGYAKKRKLSTILEGWAGGEDFDPMTLKIKGATSSLNVMKDELVKAIEDKKFLKALRSMKTIDGEPLLSTKHLDGYRKVEHGNFVLWEPTSNIGKEEARGQNFFTDNEGMVWERKTIYAPEHIAKNLNNILGVSKLKGIPVFDFITKYNTLFKQIILQSSLFHHFAFGRSYYLGTSGKKWADMSLRGAWRNGLEYIRQEEPYLILLVRKGLTLGLKQDWEEELLRDKSSFDKALDKIGFVGDLRQWIENLRERQVNFLFNEMGAGLKAKAAVHELKQLMSKHPELNIEDAAKEVADLINNDFGGLHLQRMGRNPTIQHVFRLGALAPDWSESNLRIVFDAFKRIPKDDPLAKMRAKLKRKVARKFIMGVIYKGVMATVLANMLTAAIDEDDKETQGFIERFIRNYQRAWDEGKYRWLDVDITPIYKLAGGKKNRRKYFSIFGHFKDPLKYMFENPSRKKAEKDGTGRFKVGNIRALKHKASVIGSTALDFFTGTDWAGRRYTTLKEYLGIDKEKGEYKRSSKKYGYKKGDPKWGKLKGKTVTWGQKGVGLETDQLPSFILGQAKGKLPVQIQNIIAWAFGEMEGFDAIANSGGLGVSTTYDDEEEGIADKKTKSSTLRLLK